MTFVYDLFPDFENIPAETWRDADVEGATEDMIRRSTFTTDEIARRDATDHPISLLELATNQKPFEVTNAARERWKNSPRVLALLEAEERRQHRESR